MPGLITHYLGGKSALGFVNTEIHEHIGNMINLFNLGTQGPDIFFYHISGLITKRVRGVGSQMHNRDLGLFFLEMAESAKGSPEVFAYTAGFLAHYAIDVCTHPYVFAQTHNPSKPMLKEATRHRHFETSIDVLMLSRIAGKKPADYNLGHMLTPQKSYKEAVTLATSAAISQIYNRKIYPKDIASAFAQMARFTRYLQSQRGKRKRIIGSIETVLVRSKIISSLIHMQEVVEDIDFLNISKAFWSPPWNEDAICNDSFLDLFDKGVAYASEMISALFDYVHGRLSKDQLATIIGNRSLKTGDTI